MFGDTTTVFSCIFWLFPAGVATVDHLPPAHSIAQGCTIMAKIIITIIFIYIKIQKETFICGFWVWLLCSAGYSIFLRALNAPWCSRHFDQHYLIVHLCWWELRKGSLLCEKLLYADVMVTTIYKTVPFYYQNLNVIVLYISFCNDFV